MSDLSKAKNTRSPTFWTKSSFEPGAGPTGPVADGGVTPPPPPLVLPVSDLGLLQAATTSNTAASRLIDRRFISYSLVSNWECVRRDLFGQCCPVGPHSLDRARTRSVPRP